MMKEMLFTIFFCTTLVIFEPVSSFFVRPVATITKQKTIITTQTVAPTCYELAEDFSVCGRNARQYGFDTFANSPFHAFDTALESDLYNYYPAAYIQPSFDQSNGRGNYRFLTGGIGGMLVSKETRFVSATVFETSGQTEIVTINCLNPGERVPQNMCARNPCVPNPCTRNGDKKAKCKVGDSGSYSCQCSSKKFFSNGITCVGNQQSPVDIITKNAKPKDMPDLLFTNYGPDPIELIITNTGKTAQASVTTSTKANARDSDGEKITIGGADLDGTYEFEQFHFHWNLEHDEDGSEHTIDGKGYPSEIHFVHRNSKYGSVEEALKKRDGLAVIAVLFKEGAQNDNYMKIFDSFQRIKKAKSKTPVEDPPSLMALLPEDTEHFYRYKGSLTTKPFTENVEWIVMEVPLTLSKDQLLEFGELLDSDGEPILFNDREVQPIRDRDIFKRKTSKYSTKDSFLLPQNRSD